MRFVTPRAVHALLLKIGTFCLQSLSDIVKRLDAIENKLDKLSQISKCSKNTPSSMSQEERGSPSFLPMEVSLPKKKT